MPQETQRILVVDDEAPVRDIFAKGLTRHGYQCDTAGSAEDANRMLQEDEFDLVLLDISMPGETGLYMLATLVDNYPDMAVIMVTGNDELDTAVYAMRQGADDFLSKPVGIALLVYRIEKVLSRRAILLENKAYHAHLEQMVSELNLRLDQSRSLLATLNSIVQSLMARELETPQAYVGLQKAVSDIDSGLDNLADFATVILDDAPNAHRPD